ncbi:MAG: rRNA maturation RNase YbeY [Clostridiales bacterium]|nr:rRNA maturation RNase YbeY [Clostridiales bacterium]
MSLSIEEECEVKFDFSYGTLAESVVDFCLKHENFPCSAQVSLTLCDDAGIRGYNSDYRQVDEATDVLSFPMFTYDEPGDFSFLTDGGEGNFDPDTGEAVLGDIVISVDHVHAQAREYGHSEKREFAFLITHSMLHLLGYDHMDKDDAKVMEDKQREILEELGIPREYE